MNEAPDLRSCDWVLGLRRIVSSGMPADESSSLSDASCLARDTASLHLRKSDRLACGPRRAAPLLVRMPLHRESESASFDNSTGSYSRRHLSTRHKLLGLWGLQVASAQNRRQSLPPCGGHHSARGYPHATRAEHTLNGGDHPIAVRCAPLELDHFSTLQASSIIAGCPPDLQRTAMRADRC